MRQSQHRLAGPLALLVSRYAVHIVGPLVGLLVVRYLGSEKYGLYASAAAVTSLFGVLADFGLQQAGLEMASSPGSSLRLVRQTIIRIGALYSTVAYGAVAAWLYWGPYEHTIVALGLLSGLGFFQVPILTSVTVVLQLRGLYSRLAFWNLLASATTWVGTLVAILVDAGLTAIVGWPVLAGWARTVVMLVVERKLLANEIDGAGRLCDTHKYPVFQRSWKFGLSGIAYNVYHHAGPALLSLLRSPVEVGQYALAFRVIELLNAFPGIVFNQVLYPKYFKWFATEPKRVSLYYGLTFKIMAAIGVLAAVATSLWGAEVVALAFGDGYQLTGPLLGVMAWSVPVHFLAAAIGALLTTGGGIDVKVRIQGLMAVVNMAFSLVLVPSLGARGSALTLVLTELLLVAAYGIAVYRWKGLSPVTEVREVLALACLLSVGIGASIVGADAEIGICLALTGLGMVSSTAFTIMGLCPAERAELQRLVEWPRSSAS